MKLLKELDTELDLIDESKIDPSDVIGTLKMFAPIIIIVLTFVKVFTGEKADRKIDAILNYLSILKTI